MQLCLACRDAREWVERCLNRQAAKLASVGQPDQGGVQMGHDRAIQELWESWPSSGREARTEGPGPIPKSAKRYLEHAIAPGTPLAQTVRLQMHGEIKLQR